jgi:hypothetical protein
VKGRVAPASVRVVERSTKTEVPAACRSEFNVPRNRQELYLAWYARPQLGQCGAYDVYFNTQDRPVPPASYRDDQLPSENLLANPGFEDVADGLPVTWQVQPAALVRLGRCAHTSGQRSLAVVVGQGDGQRRVPVQVLVAEAPLVREAERADEISGAARVREVAELSGARGVEFTGRGRLATDLAAPRGGTHALWLRARWEPDGDSSLSLAVDGASPRPLRVTRMIGFEDWTNPGRAHTKRFHTEQHDHWAWYRIPDVCLTPGRHRLTLSAGQGTWLDALALLPQDHASDRAAMNLFQNWNFAPWHNPF